MPINRADHSHATRQIGHAGIAQDLSARTYDERQLPRIDLEAIDQRARFGIGVGVEHHAGRRVAREKALDPQHVTVFGATDDHRSANAGLEHLRAAQDQRAHQPFAKLGFGDQQCPHTVRRKDQRLDGLGN